MSSGLVAFVFVTLIALVGIFCYVIVHLQNLHAKERDDLTKKLMAKNLTEFQQERAYADYYAVKKEEVKIQQVPQSSNYLSLSELENDPVALEQLNNHVESITR
jgi:hypothetical protein